MNNDNESQSDKEFAIAEQDDINFPVHEEKIRMMSVGFEPTPMKTTALTLRLRPLGHDILMTSGIMYICEIVTTIAIK